jgi:hypothetical protein
VSTEMTMPAGPGTHPTQLRDGDHSHTLVRLPRMPASKDEEPQSRLASEARAEDSMTAYLRSAVRLRPIVHARPDEAPSTSRTS